MAWHPFRNFSLKLLALGLATLMWVTVTHDQVVERSLRVPLEFQNIPESLEITSDPPGTVDVRVRGASGILARLDAGDVVAVVDLRTARTGQRLFHLLTNQVRVPFGIEVSQINPPSIAFTFERSGRRMVPVVPVVEGEPAFGYVRGATSVAPSTVEVVGPESRLSMLMRATTEPVNIDKAMRTVEDEVTVGIEDAALRLRSPVSATVRVEIVAAPIERDVQNVPVVVRNADSRRVTVTPPTVSVTMLGRREVVGRLDVTQIAAWVDAARLAPGRYTLRVETDPRRDSSVVRIEPQLVQVRIH